MSGGIHVFLGPSLPLAEAQARLAASYHPPVAQGDLCELIVDQAPAVVAIVDGYFEQVPAVWHKEILYALSRGVRVYGASSMGAIRAAELAAFGMQGVGAVFAAFASGEYEDDDEVAIVHGPAASGFRPLSEAMVNLRAGLARAESRGVIAAATHRALLAAAKALFYADRSWLALRDAARALDLPMTEVEALLAFVSREPPDVKREDAIALLDHLAANAAAPPSAPPFEFEPTANWEKLLVHVERVRHEKRLRAGTGPAGGDAAGAAGEDAGLRDDSLLLLLAAREARRIGLPPGAPAPGLDELVRLEGCCAALRAHYDDEIVPFRTLARQRRDGGPAGRPARRSGGRPES